MSLPDREYDLSAENAIIADLEHMDEIKAENHRLKAAITAFRDAKGRDANISAMARLFSLIEPKKEPNS